MEKNKNILDYIGMTLMQYGFTIIIISLFAFSIGDNAKDFSAMFSLGSKGLSLSVMLEFLILTIIIVCLRYVFFTDRIICHLSLAARMVCMMTSVLITTSIFICIFQWFPIHNIYCWALFIICFLLSTLCSMIMMSAKEKLENKQLDEALKKYQRGEKDETRD